VAQAGFDQCDSLQIWQGLAHEAWEANALLAELRGRIEQEQAWTTLEVGGYRVKAMDTVGLYWLLTQFKPINSHIDYQKRHLPDSVLCLAMDELK